MSHTININVYTKNKDIRQTINHITQFLTYDYNCRSFNSIKELYDFRVYDRSINVFLVDFKSLTDIENLLFNVIEDSRFWVIFNIDDISEKDSVQWIERGFVGVISILEMINHFDHIMTSITRGQMCFPKNHVKAVIKYYQDKFINKNGQLRCFLSESQLTAKEQDICILVLDGLSNRQIARKKNISIHTVKTHIHNIMAKLCVSSRAELMSLVIHDYKESVYDL